MINIEDIKNNVVAESKKINDIKEFINKSYDNIEQ